MIGVAEERADVRTLSLSIANFGLKRAVGETFWVFFFTSAPPLGSVFRL